MSEVSKPVDPSAIGLFGLAIATLVASSEKLGLTSGLSYVLPWVLFLGGFAQLIAGIYDYKKGNVFGATAFLAFGLFWLAITFTWLMGLNALGDSLFSNIDTKELGFAFLGYLIFTIYMTIGALETNKVLFTIFFFIIILFVGLTFSTFGVMVHEMKLLAGIAELIVSLLSFYASAANVLNIHFGRTFLPIGKPFGIIKKVD
ncbi:acetate uptake transporter [Thorsellia anophelis]|uniref:Uncharacterized protein n=1 Tax=Thorsellia anophelis DSM 18579 TaxID=1123402 RepID=A0A1H9ZVM5_9GAMM|nr:GPR1/FUN34/YaaH family transporter [Thorsellia anophelis]SES85754.1 hypothetical protein SAMN02583745_00724 [Thorsellia anophelis DSM 18579]